MLSAAPSEYTVGQILRATEGSLAPVACLEGDPNQCRRCHKCLTLPVWEGLEEIISRYLDSITHQDVLDGRLPGL